MTKKVLIISSANGVNRNLGDEAMFEVLSSELKTAGVELISDGWKHYQNSKLIRILPYIFYLIPIRYFGPVTNLINIIRYFLTEYALKYSWVIRLLKLDPRLKLYNQVISQVELVVISGGGYMEDQFASQGIYGRGMIVNLAALHHKKLVVSGNGIGPIQSKYNRSLAKRYLNRIDKVFVRDRTGSRKELVDLGYPLEQIEEFVDDAFFLGYSPDDLNFVRQILSQHVKNKFAVINVHDWVPKLKAKLFPALEEIVSSSPDLDFVLLPNYFGGKQDDGIILSKLQEYLLHKKLANIFLWTKPISPQQVKAIFTLAEFSIATRYHTGVFSLSVGTPAVLVYVDKGYYKQKMIGALDWYNLKEYAVSVEDANGLLAQLADMIRKDRDNIALQIKLANQAYQQQGYQAGEYIKRMLTTTG